MIGLELINDDHLTAPDSKQFQRWLNQVADQLEASGEVCIKIIDETESRYLNHTYRSQDKPTNVLSFPSEVPDFVESDHLGDLAICASVVEQEAKDQGKAVSDHWAHMSIHGLLHLLGYDHIEVEDAELMESLETSILANLSIKDPYS